MNHITDFETMEPKTYYFAWSLLLGASLVTLFGWKGILLTIGLVLIMYRMR